MPGRQHNTYEGEKTITVKQVRSAIGNKPKAHGTLRALGLGRIGRSNVLPDRPEIRGMIARVPHLIAVTESTTDTVTTGTVTNGSEA